VVTPVAGSNDCTAVCTVVAAPPKTRMRPPAVTAAAPWVGSASAPTLVTAPVAGVIRTTSLMVTPAAFTPPSTNTAPPAAAAIVRNTGAGSRYLATVAWTMKLSGSGLRADAVGTADAAGVRDVPAGGPAWTGLAAGLQPAASNRHGVSSAALAYRNMRAKTSVLQEALTGHFTEHHAFMLGMMLARIDALTTQIDTLTTRIGEAIAPFAAQVAQLDEIPGIGITAAQDLLAEIGTDMSRFPDAGHLVSWAKFAPKARQSAGRSKAASTGKGNPWLGGTLGEAAAGAARTKTFLASRYKRIVRRRGKQRALVAVGNSILTIIWHLLSDPAAHFTDLGPDWHDRLAPLRRKRQLIAELERLSGKKVTLHDTV